MNMLLHHVTLHNPNHPLHLTACDILIKDGLIDRIEPKIKARDVEVWEGEDLHVSPGWVDIGAQSMDPGQEHREDLNTLVRSAGRGGYTHLAVFPNTEPVVHSKAEVLYLQKNNRTQVVQIHPIGAVSRDAKGDEIAEMYDMHAAGAIAFSDGSHPIEKAGVLLRALMYVKAMNGVVIDQPLDPSLSIKGQVHEGSVSTMLGMQGIPALAESVQVYRNIQLLRYADSHLVLHAISASESLDMIRRARKEGLHLGATVPAWNLVFTDDAVRTYDTRYKLMPPLRGSDDRKALQKAVKEGLIEAIVSQHVPLEDDQKEVEFPYAAFGSTGLETTFAMCCTHLVPNILTLDDLVHRMSTGPRKLLSMPGGTIQVGEPADLTVFQPEQTWTFTIADQISKGRNNPLDGVELRGRVFGVIANQQSIRH
ncbi:MAG: dihydroorotase [Saprospiraceae bacterium]|nr:dihydroorotase [Saprospiraceae bacterium]